MTIARRQFVQGLAATGALAATSGPVFAQSAPITLKWANNIPATHPSTVRIKEAAALEWGLIDAIEDRATA